ncbi:MAG TPA: hypothetical protein DCE42_26690 [Myxococcales bacterium]|nr:hypothetical protein [Deltaproteobacteria bacterium]MBU49879.1 hypothetical protein [Deltaproteobacteria bacterium]HAA58379.1 hypothetical protein [Myxococcales bacterium]
MRYTAPCSRNHTNTHNNTLSPTYTKESKTKAAAKVNSVQDRDALYLDMTQIDTDPTNNAVILREQEKHVKTTRRTCMIMSFTESTILAAQMNADT